MLILSVKTTKSTLKEKMVIYRKFNLPKCLSYLYQILCFGWLFDNFMYWVLFWHVTMLVDILVIDHLSYYQKYQHHSPTISHNITEWSLVKSSVQISTALNSWLVLHFWGFKFKLLDTVAPSNRHDLQLWPTFLTQIVGWHQKKSTIMSSKFWWSKSTV